MKKRTVWVMVSIAALLVVCAVAAIAARPATVQPVTFSASLCTTGGEMADCTVDARIARMVENGVDLPHYEGTLTLNGVQHIDFLTRFTSSQKRRGVPWAVAGIRRAPTDRIYVFS